MRMQIINSMKLTNEEKENEIVKALDVIDKYGGQIGIGVDRVESTTFLYDGETLQICKSDKPINYPDLMKVSQLYFENKSEYLTFEEWTDYGTKKITINVQDIIVIIWS